MESFINTSSTKSDQSLKYLFGSTQIEDMYYAEELKDSFYERVDLT